jgi:hypothetical protein
MPGDYLPDDLKTLWAELDTNPVQLPPEKLRREARKVQNGVHRRFVIGGGAALIVMVGFTCFFFIFPNWIQRIGSALTVLGAGYMMVQLGMRPAPPMPDFSQTGSVHFYRAELERQRDFHRGKWFWSRFLIFLPGPLIWCVGFSHAHPEIDSFIRLEFVAILVLAALTVPVNLRLARVYQRRINAIDASIQSDRKVE